MTGRQLVAAVGARAFFIVTVILLLGLAPFALVHATGPVGHAPGGGIPNFLVAVGAATLAWVAFMACFLTARREPVGNAAVARRDPQSPDLKGHPVTNPYPNQPPAYQPPPAPAPAAPKAKKSKTWVWILGIVVAFVLGLSIGGSGSSSTTAGPATTVTVTAPAGGSVAADPPATSAAPVVAGPKTEFGDGTFKVGEDIAVGSYKSTGPRTGSAIPNCYWARMKNDSGQLDAVIANNNSQGATRITVKKGEFLQVQGCDFTKA